MGNIAPEEMGDACPNCGESEYLCNCRRCAGCEEVYAKDDLTESGFCCDCSEEIQGQREHEKIEKAFVERF
jgi:hypothetical protein